MSLNKKDGGNRKFILCTNNESNICEEKTYHRLSCVINGYDFIGKKKETIFKQKIGVRELRHIQDYLDDIAELKEQNTTETNSCKLSFKDNILQLDVEEEIKEKMPPIVNNLKYYRTDFIPKNTEELFNMLNQHISEMVQLEYGVKLDGKNYVMVMDEEEIDTLSMHWHEFKDTIKAIFKAHDTLLDSEQESLFADVPIYEIPDYYFDFELREAGEIW